MVAPIQTALTILRRKQVEARCGLSRSTIYDKISPKSKTYDPSFSRPIDLGGKAVGWLEHEIDAWIQARIDASRSKREFA
jgi:prophage regulatory protein